MDEGEPEPLDRVLDGLFDPFVVLEAVRDEAGQIVDFVYVVANQAACAYNGLDVEDLIGRRLLELMPGSVAAGLLDQYVRVVETGDPLALDDFAYEQELRGGQARRYDVRAVRIGDGLSYTWRDVTQRAAEARYRSTLASLAEGVVVFGPDGTIAEANAAAERILGLSHAELKGRTEFAPTVVHEDGTPFAGHLHPAGVVLASGQPVRNLVMGVTQSDGALTWLLVNAEPLAIAGTVGVVVSFTDITELRAMQSQTEMVLDNIADVVIRYDATGRVLWASPSLSRVFGYEPTEIVGSPFRMSAPGDADRLFELITEAARQQRDVVALPVRVRRADGALRWADMTVRLVYAPDGSVDFTVASLRDATAEVVAAEARAASEQKYRMLAENASDVVAQVDRDGRIQWVSDSVTEVLGWDPLEVVGRGVPEFVAAEDRDRLAAAFRDFTGAAIVKNRFRMLTRDGSGLWMATRVKQFDADGDAALVVTLRDINSEVAAQEELSFRAFHDPLTGVHNRAWILDRLEKELRTAQRSGTAVGVLFIDLDDFKSVNDCLGHAAGDEVLAVVAARIGGVLRARDEVGRIGGDEFVVVVPEIHEPQDALVVAERIRAAIGVDMVVAGHRITPTGSLGVAISETASTPESVLREADAALARAKDAGRDRWRLFDEAMHARALDRVAMEGDLRHALEQHQFHVHYQPIVNLVSGHVVGHEALIGWDHPTRGPIEAESFLAMAEDCGLIVPLGTHVLDRICATLGDQPDLPGTASLNVNVAQLQCPDWLGSISSTLSAHDADPRRLVVSVTETALLSKVEAVSQSLVQLRHLGVGIHLDDFGAGHSSISMLRDLPITGLKLDPRLVAGLTPDPSAANALTAGIAGLVKGLGLMGIARGIQTPQQAATLAGQGWELAQGDLYGPAAANPWGAAVQAGLGSNAG